MTREGFLFDLPDLSPFKSKTEKVLLPTPSASDCQRGPARYFDPSASSNAYRTLVTFAARFYSQNLQSYLKTGIVEVRNDEGQEGSLPVMSPVFVEALMGYPKNWTKI